MNDEIHLRKPEKEIKLTNIFRKAVKGYRLVGSRAVVKAPMQTILPAMVETSEAKPQEKKDLGGIFVTEAPKFIRKTEPEIDLRAVNIVYPLIPRDSKNPFAAANIKWSKAESALVYYVVEPQLSPNEKDLLEKIKQSLIEKLDVDFSQLKREEARSYLRRKFQEMISLMASSYPIEKQ